MLFDKPKKNMQQMEYNIRIRMDDAKKQGVMTENESEGKKTMEEEETKTFKEQSKEKASLKQVISAIIEGGKPIVGHFPNLDLGLIFQTFLKDLP